MVDIKKAHLRSFEDLFINDNIIDFFNSNWEKELYYLNRKHSSFYKGLFSIKNFDTILEYGKPQKDNLRVVKNQQPLLSSKYKSSNGDLNLNQLYAAYTDGYTLVINEIHKYWEPINILVQNMRHKFSHNVLANAYLTPANQKALSAHYDTHDVFVLQISGKKHWNFYDDTNFKTPLLNSFQPIFNNENLSGKKEVTVKAGDLMYVPRGLPHEAYTSDESSLHLTIGVYPIQYADFFSKSFQSLAQNDIELRKSLPVGFLNFTNEDKNKFIEYLSSKFKNRLHHIFEKKNLDNTFFSVDEEFRNEVQPKSDGHFEQLDKISHLTLDDKLTKRNNMAPKVIKSGAFSRIVFPGNVIKGPIQLASIFEYVSQTKYFFVKDIPKVNEENKLKIAKRLVRGGLLKIVE